MRNIPGIFVIFLITLCGSMGSAEPFVINSDFESELVSRHFKVLKDSSHEIRIQDLAEGKWDQKFTSFSPHEVIQFATEDQWFKIDLHNPTNQPQTLYLISHFPIAEIGYFHQSDQQLIRKVAGSALRHLQEVRFLRSTFRIEAKPGITSHYFKVNPHGHPAVFQFQLFSADNFSKFSIYYQVILSLAFGAILAILIYNIFLALISYRSFAIPYLMYLMLALGLLAILLEATAVLPSSISYFINSNWIFFAVGSFIFGILFVIKFIEINKNDHPYLFKIIKLFFLCCTTIFRFEHAPMITSIVIIGTGNLAIVCFLFVGARRYLLNNPMAFFTITAFLTVVISNPIIAAAALGTMPISISFAIYFRLASGVIESILLSTAFGMSIRNSQNEYNHYKQSLEGMLPKELISAAMKNRQKLIDNISEKRVTIMFVDIVGYSLSSSILVPRKAFHELKQVLSEMKEIILKNGGIIDKTLGDGLLCFFGYDFLNESDINHALSGFQCAIEIQNHSMSKVTVKSEDKKLVYPLRIGLNTAVVCIGNMGNERHFDFTLSGEGVIMANRYESACEPFKIIIGPETYQSIHNHYSNQLIKRMIKIKHREELEEAWEYDPFHNRVDELLNAKNIYWDHHNYIQKYKRYNLTRGHYFIESQYGLMEMLNFSKGGFLLRSHEIFLGRGVQMEVILQNAAIELEGMMPFIVEVVWGRSTLEGGFLHGVQIIGMSRSNRDQLYDYLWSQLHNSLRLIS